MKDPDALSPEYTAIHRFSLIWSSVLFISCFASVKSTLNIGIELDDVGTKALVLLILIASTYSIIVLYVEWYNSALPFYKKACGILIENHEAIAKKLAEIPSQAILWHASFEQVKELFQRHNFSNFDQHVIMRTLGRMEDQYASSLPFLQRQVDRVSGLKTWANLGFGMRFFQCFIIGLAAPFSLYFLAASHAVGRLGYIAFPSPLVSFLKSLDPPKKVDRSRALHESAPARSMAFLRDSQKADQLVKR